MVDSVATILIADDRELMRVALRTLFVLRPNWEICGEAEDDREATFFACFLTFAHLFLAALAIPARPAADKTRFFMPTISRSGMSQGICSRTHSIQLALQLG